MNDILPLAPQLGISGPWYLIITLVIGVLFGLSLEKAGFGSSKILTDIFILRDFRVFRVMFTAVITAMLGIHVLHYFGVVNLSLIPFEKNFFWAIAIGGLVFGVGFYVGGFCPGTAIVASARGRWDGPAFLVGIVIGIYGFALLFDQVGTTEWFSNFYAPADAQATTLYGDGPSWPWVLGITGVAFMGFWITPKVERRFGLKTVAELEREKAGKPLEERAPVVAPSAWRWLGPALAGAFAVALIAAEMSTPFPALANNQPREAVDLIEITDDLDISAQSLAGWIIENAHRAEAGRAPNVAVFDLRPESERAAIEVPTATPVAFSDSSNDENVLAVLEALSVSGVPDGKPVVLITGHDQDSLALVQSLRSRHVWVQLIAGGPEAWRSEVLDWQPVQSSAAQPPTQLSLWQLAQPWLAGQSDDLPPRFVFPGAIPPETQVASTVATGAGEGGGCN